MVELSLYEVHKKACPHKRFIFGNYTTEFTTLKKNWHTALEILSCPCQPLAQ